MMLFAAPVLVVLAATAIPVAHVLAQPGEGGHVPRVTADSIGIGTASPSAPLHVVAPGERAVAVRFENGSGACDYIPTASGSGIVSCSSDARLKEDVVDAGSQLSWLKGFRIREYTVKADGARQTGVIAQELEDAHPGMVRTGPDGILTVNTPSPWKMIRAMQELQEQNSRLDAALRALQVELQTLKAQ